MPLRNKHSPSRSTPWFEVANTTSPRCRYTAFWWSAKPKSKNPDLLDRCNMLSTSASGNARTLALKTRSRSHGRAKPDVSRTRSSSSVRSLARSRRSDSVSSIQPCIKIRTPVAASRVRYTRCFRYPSFASSPGKPLQTRQFQSSGIRISQGPECRFLQESDSQKHFRDPTILQAKPVCNRDDLHAALRVQLGSGLC